jgi:xanthine dehydrogenase YagS FAD-binding subunit
VLGPQGKRAIPLANFFQAPKSENDREHVLKPNEILTSVSMNAHPYKNASYEVRHKQAYDWPLAQAACSFEIKDGKAVDVRIVLGHVGPTPILSKAAGEALLNKPITEETATAAGKAATEGAKPLSQNGYKVQLAQVAVKRAILTAAGMKKYWEV